jgi:hypothetical protein
LADEAVLLGEAAEVLPSPEGLQHPDGVHAGLLDGPSGEALQGRGHGGAELPQSAHRREMKAAERRAVEVAQVRDQGGRGVEVAELTQGPEQVNPHRELHAEAGAGSALKVESLDLQSLEQGGRQGGQGPRRPQGHGGEAAPGKTSARVDVHTLKLLDEQGREAGVAVEAHGDDHAVAAPAPGAVLGLIEQGEVRGVAQGAQVFKGLATLAAVRVVLHLGEQAGAQRGGGGRRAPGRRVAHPLGVEQAQKLAGEVVGAEPGGGLGLSGASGRAYAELSRGEGQAERSLRVSAAAGPGGGQGEARRHHPLAAQGVEERRSVARAAVLAKAHRRRLPHPGRRVTKGLHQRRGGLGLGSAHQGPRRAGTKRRVASAQRPAQTRAIQSLGAAEDQLA